MLNLHTPLSEVYREEGFAIFIGTAANAANPRALAEAGVKYILNVSDRIRFKRVNEGPVITLYHVPLSDFGDTVLSGSGGVLDECFTTINEARENQGNILVHCQGGVNRSPTVVIAYLMTSVGWSLRKSWEQVKEKRHVASPHERYMQQLIDYEIELFGAATLDFAEYEQNSLQASLRKLRQQAMTEYTNTTNSTNSSTELLETTQTITNSTSNSLPTINHATTTPTTIISANGATNIPPNNTSNTEASPPDKKKLETWKYHFHTTTPTHHLPQLNLECIS